MFNPFTEELFYATRGGGAFLNGRKIEVSTKTAVHDALLVAAFSSARGDKKKKEYELFGKLNDSSRGVLRLGSAALALAYLACGRVDPDQTTVDQVIADDFLQLIRRQDRSLAAGEHVQRRQFDIGFDEGRARVLDDDLAFAALGRGLTGKTGQQKSEGENDSTDSCHQVPGSRLKMKVTPSDEFVN